MNVNFTITGRGTVSNKDEGAIEYGGGAARNPMEDLVNDLTADPAPAEDTAEISAEAAVEPAPEVTEEAPTAQTIVLDESKIVTEAKLSPAKSVPFDPTAITNALLDSEDEGGAAPYRSTGLTASGQVTSTDEEGLTIKPTPNMDDSPIEGQYEITGFTVEYEPKISAAKRAVSIRDFFETLEQAYLSINGNKYLMPVPNGYKVATIMSGRPVICYNDRLVYEYVEGDWKRV
jgi:hypothetical protein